MHPNVKVRIVEGYSSLLPAMVASDDIDFAISTLHGGETGVDARPLLSTPECLVSRYDPDDPGDWPTEPINIIWASGMEGRRAAITASLAANGVQIASAFEIDSALASLDLVSRSDWRMVNPAVMIDPVADAGRLQVRPLTNPDLMFNIMLLHRTSTCDPARSRGVHGSARPGGRPSDRGLEEAIRKDGLTPAHQRCTWPRRKFIMSGQAIRLLGRRHSQR